MIQDCKHSQKMVRLFEKGQRDVFMCDMIVKDFAAGWMLDKG